jgi:hypothetical protein
MLNVGNQITQQSISAIQLTVTEIPTNYQFNLVGSPRSGGTVNGVFPGPKGPTVLLLGNSGLTANGTGSAKGPFCPKGDRICANGGLVLNGGSTNCGNGNVTANGIYGVTAAGQTCGTLPSGGPQIVAPSPPVPDPVKDQLPPCFPSSLANLPTYTSTAGGTLTPGIYHTGSAISGSQTLEPGVYVFEDGVNANFAMATPLPSDPYYNVGAGGSYDPTAGVLIYLPGSGPYPLGCLTSTSMPSSDTITGSIVPLNSLQSATWFNGNSHLAYMWLWQDKTNANPLTLSGSVTLESHYQIKDENPYGTCEDPTDNSILTTPPYYGGLMYLPSAVLVTSNGNPTITVGRAIVGGLNFAGTPAFALTGC